ncbi:efflux RND transporter permease subunit (plasmid) [Acetobacter sp. AC2005]|uniref:efflux RND transporter permease subunit n=1 Tax=Acetobacter sp. AC2005 TaxID=3134142 RepID=UPI0030CE96C2
MTGRSFSLQAAIIGFSIRFRGVVIATACLLFFYGLYGLRHASYDVFPEFIPPRVTIQTEAAGFTPEQVETLVSRPMEIALSGLPGIQRVQSTSIQGLSVVNVLFATSTDIYRARQLVGEQMNVVAQQLPAGVHAPTMTPLTSSAGLVLVIGLTSEQQSLMQLRTLADWSLRPRLLALPGVAGVSVFGGERRSLQIQVHPDQLILHHIGLDDVLAAAQEATGIQGAGFIDTPNQRVVLQSDGQALTPESLARTVIVRSDNGAVTLGSIATVTEAPIPAFGAASIEGKTGIVVNIWEQYGANTMAVTREIEAALTDFRPQLQGQGITLHADLFRPANFITTALGNATQALLLGGFLVVAVIFLFLFDLRTAAICCATIPLAILIALSLLETLGVTLNAMTLGGLAIAIGEVVDDAVIGVENVTRRLRENRLLVQPASTARVVLDACVEVRSAVVYATFAVIIVFLPVIALPGLSGRLFAPLATAYVLAVMASLAAAVTVVPALCAWLLATPGETRREPPLAGWTARAYERLLARLMRHPRFVIGGMILTTLIGFAALPFLESDFIPDFKEGHLIIHMTAVPGTSLEQSLKLGRQVTEKLRQLPEIRSVAQRVGRASLDEDTSGPHTSEFEVDLNQVDGKASRQIDARVRKALDGFVGASFSVSSFLTMRVNETLSGSSSAVAINIIGDDLDVLDIQANNIVRMLHQIHGATDVRIEAPPGVPELAIRLRPADLERWGLRSADVLRSIHTAWQGETVGQIYERSAAFNVMVRLDDASRNDVASVGSLPLHTVHGNYVPLRAVADIYETNGRYQVSHLGAQRTQTVTANVTGRSAQSFVQDARTAIAKNIKLPLGTYVQFTSAAEAESQSRKELFINSGLAAIAVMILLSIITQGWRNLALILVNLPFAFVGGILTIIVSGTTLTLGATVGFVTLFGITLRNSVMMISHFEALVEREDLTWGVTTALRGARDRVVPVLMTSLVTALGLAPLAVDMNAPGREIEGPMAAVILGGLMTSMILNLFVLPILAVRFGSFSENETGVPETLFK